MARKKNHVVGMDLGGTKMLTAVFDLEGKLVKRLKSKTRIDEGENFFFRSIVDSIRSAVEEAGLGLADLAGIGIGCPGIVDPKEDVILSSPNIPFLKNCSLGARLKKSLNVPVVVENDVNTGLYGEYHFGVAQGFDNVIGIFMGTGIGGGLILNGKLYRGSTGAAGEVGHLLMDPLGPTCGCGRRGCLEAMAGRLAIASEAAALAAKQQAPKLFKETGADVLQIKSSALARAVKAGDRAVEELIRIKSRLVGIAMANIVNLLNPDLIVLGGGLVEAMEDIILEEATQSMREHAMPPLVKTVKVAAAKLGDDAIIMGAAQFIQDQISRKS